MKGKYIQFAAGVLVGAALFGGGTAYAAGVMAEPSWQDIYIDGQQVQMTAYNIGGNNYVKLRDIGKAVGFNVYWQDGVQIDSDAPYTGEAPASAPAIPAADAEAVQVGSVKGDTLKAGERSMLIIGPTGVTYAVSSSDPEAVGVENVSGYWVAVAKVPGTAVITATDGTGKKGTLTLTVEPADSKPAVDLAANMEIRKEMARLINEVRVENGVAELSISDALMNAAQDCSAQMFRNHDPYEWESVKKYGWKYGGGINLTWFNQAGSSDIAQRAVTNWVNSSGHFQTMLTADGTCLGTGVTIQNDIAYCYMFLGNPNGHNPYE